MSEPICAACGFPIKRVNLAGTAFFERASRKDSWVWQHEDKERNYTHQARPVMYR